MQYSQSKVFMSHATLPAEFHHGRGALVAGEWAHCPTRSSSDCFPPLVAFSLSTSLWATEWEREEEMEGDRERREENMLVGKRT